MTILTDIWHDLLLAVGFGFVIFFHELGHFLAAKWRGVKVEQFAVGFGSAIISWRKGLGFRWGTSGPEYDRLLAAEREGIQTTDVHAIGETEYRLNWVPLGGYVKMLGQDDLNPNSVPDDPRAYNNKSIGSRMIIISAGVIMNVILAAVGFMIVFLMGFHAPPAEVGGIFSDSPAAYATRADGTNVPLAVGDRIIKLDDRPQADYTKLGLWVALGRPGKPLSLLVRHRDGTEETLFVTAQRMESDSKDFLSMGVLPPSELQGMDPRDAKDVAEMLKYRDLFLPDSTDVMPGERITAINGQAVAAPDKADDYWMLDQALRDSDGTPITLTVLSADGKTSRNVPLLPHFEQPFDFDAELNFTGMVPRVAVMSITPDSPAEAAHAKPGDVVEGITQKAGNDTRAILPRRTLMKLLNTAGEQNTQIQLTVQQPGQLPRLTDPVIPNLQLGENKKGMGLALMADEQSTVLSDVMPGSAADRAGIKAGWQVTSVDAHPVANWFQVRHRMLDASADRAIAIDAKDMTGQTHHLTFNPTADELLAMRNLTFTNDLMAVLHERIEVRKTSNPLIAAQWGLVETRDFILQFYLTLQRMLDGSVSYTHAMGPVGIFTYGAKFAEKGSDWLIWFLAMISANLAVVNFLPFPVVDGGQFCFLLLEKIQGRPLSDNAQKIVQVVGLAMILGIFLIVTYQDIARLFGRA